MALDAVSSFPATIMAGTTHRITLAGGSYPATAWTGILAIVGDQNDARATWTASGSDHAFVFTKAATGSWTPGEYRWHFIAEQQSSLERIEVDGGTFYVSRNVADSAQYRSPEEQTLAALKAYQLGEIEAGAAESFSIDGQSFNNIPAAQIAKLIGVYESRVQLLRNREHRRGAGGNKRNVETTLI